MKPFSKEVIQKNTKIYSNKNIAFRALLGGIGTGNISLDGDGRMVDFEVMGHADKDVKVPYTFFSIYSSFGQEPGRAYVLEAAPSDLSVKAVGRPSGELYGLPRMDSCTIKTNYPYYTYHFEREGLPLDITMEAYTPFIPLDVKNSSIPGFVCTYWVRNMSDESAQVSVCGSLQNFTGQTGYDGYEIFQEGAPDNEAFLKDGLTGVNFINKGLDKGAVNYGSVSLATSNSSVTLKPQWYHGGWFDAAEEFWQDFSADGKLCTDTAMDVIGSKIGNPTMPRMIGSVCASETLEPGECREFVFYVSWYFPNRYGWWPDGHRPGLKPDDSRIFQNYYSTQWTDAEDVACYLYAQGEMLYNYSRNFADALYSTTLDADVIESLVSAITVIRSNTCFRLSDGHFFGWEGCFEHAGSCPGTCTHVWNYAQALAFLFPELEMSIRRTEFLEETDEEGNMTFRAKRFLEGQKWDMLPATDGQLGCIMRVYREWMLTGDDEFLKQVWDKVVLAMEFSLRFWDQDRDYVLESQQHNTYDIEFYGLNSLTNSILYGALNAGAAMADYLGEPELSAKWKKAAKEGAEKMDAQLWNGEYYQQKIDGEDLARYKYQYGKGCLADQLLGQELAHVYGLGYVFPKEHVKKAAYAIYKYNFKTDMRDHQSVQRNYSYQDEPGLVLCSWPDGGRPIIPFPYSDEVWTGIEYQVATHLIYEGYIHEAMDIVHGIRKRYDGMRRSPYNEQECGNHYARSMAAWGLLVALSGYQFDMPGKKISFSPKVDEREFTCFYSNGSSWGIYRQSTDLSGEKSFEITPLYGNLDEIEVKGL